MYGTVLISTWKLRFSLYNFIISSFMQIIINYIITSFDSTGHCQIELRRNHPHHRVYNKICWQLSCSWYRECLSRELYVFKTISEKSSHQESTKHSIVNLRNRNRSIRLWFENWVTPAVSQRIRNLINFIFKVSNLKIIARPFKILILQVHNVMYIEKL